MSKKPKFAFALRSALFIAMIICYFAGVFNLAFFLFEKGYRTTVDMFAVGQIG